MTKISGLNFQGCRTLPAALVSMNPLRWLTLFGPGAIMASLTIGTGELIFSSRAGSMFGYRVLFLFLVILILKWTLVFSTARHMVLTGVHPVRRWLDLPIGPRGWLPAVMFVFAAICIPIWVSFHASVVGDLFASLTGTKAALHGASSYLWGVLTLVGVVLLAFKGGYVALEKVQLGVVALMLLAVSLSLLLLKPDWLEMLVGMILPQRLDYPEWLKHDPRPEMQKIASRPVWNEAALYAGVIGGASYDYLAYTSFLRNKHWGLAGTPASPRATQSIDADESAKLKLWIRAPLIDCTISFIIVFVFSAVFVASGWLVLGPNHQIPGDGNFLDHQAQFVTRLHPWLFPLYLMGTLLAMLGTLYGTLEIAPVILRESFQLLRHQGEAVAREKQLRKLGLSWTALGAFAVLILSFFVRYTSANTAPPGLTTLLVPANLFTGVLSCGIICMLNPWMDRMLPSQLRPGVVLSGLNVIAGVVFLLLGLKGYWEYGGLSALSILLGTIGVGFLVAIVVRPVLVDSEAT